MFIIATAAVLDPLNGEELKTSDITARDWLTPSVLGVDTLPGGAIRARTPSTLSVADYRRLIDDLHDYTAQRIADEAR